MTLKLTLHTSPEVPLEAEILAADKLAKLEASEIEQQTVFHGNEQLKLADFFRVEGGKSDKVELEGDLRLVKHIGAGMNSGQIAISGNVGSHLGAGMGGGEIIVDGDAGTGWHRKCRVVE